DLVLLYATEVVDLERQKQTDAEAVWDLLDVRLLLDRPSAQRPTGQPLLLTIRICWPSPARSPPACNASTARHCAGAYATAASTSATAASARCFRSSAPRTPPADHSVSPHSWKPLFP